MKLLPRSGQFIALTGNIGAGKSFVLKILAKHGFKTIKLDDYAKSIIHANDEVKQKIKDKFPVVFENSLFNNIKLAKIIFSNKKNLKIVEDIIHPYTLQKILQLKKESCENGRSIVVESALIFEKNRSHYFDCIINVIAKAGIRYQRLRNERQMSEKLFANISKLQWSADKTFDKSQFILYNNNRLNTLKQIKSLIL